MVSSTALRPRNFRMPVLDKAQLWLAVPLLVGQEVYGNKRMVHLNLCPPVSCPRLMLDCIP